MKKTTVILCVLALLGVSYWAQARMMVMAVPPTTAGGASGVYRPNADVTITNWYACDDEPTNFCSYIDDEVTAPTAGTGGLNCLHAGETAAEFAFPEITGTVTTLRVRTYAKVGGPSDGELTFSVSRDGTTWVSVGTVAITEDDAYAWLYTDVGGLSWDGTTDLRLRVTSTITDRSVDIDVIYLEANP